MNMNDRIEKFMKKIGEHVSAEFMEWLVKEGFFTAPASTKYHGSYEGGLFDHSLEVAEVLVQLTHDNWFLLIVG